MIDQVKAQPAADSQLETVDATLDPTVTKTVIQTRAPSHHQDYQQASPSKHQDHPQESLQFLKLATMIVMMRVAVMMEERAEYQNTVNSANYPSRRAPRMIQMMTTTSPMMMFHSSLSQVSARQASQAVTPASQSTQPRGRTAPPRQ